MNTAAEEENYVVPNITANKHVKFHVHLFDAETEATTWSIAEMDHVANKLQRVIEDITSIEPMQLKKELSIRSIEFEAW